MPIAFEHLHRVHHSALMTEGNRNFGNVFPWWDRLFATYQAAPKLDHKRMELGLEEARAPEDVTLPKLLALPFRSTRMVASA
jgi:sterol desaturase/sphingolipid hydroxylase (fatty acid hydroxylase superfamily)